MCLGVLWWHFLGFGCEWDQVWRTTPIYPGSCCCFDRASASAVSHFWKAFAISQADAQCPEPLIWVRFDFPAEFARLFWLAWSLLPDSFRLFFNRNSESWSGTAWPVLLQTSFDLRMFPVLLPYLKLPPSGFLVFHWGFKFLSGCWIQLTGFKTTPAGFTENCRASSVGSAAVDYKPGFKN